MYTFPLIFGGICIHFPEKKGIVVKQIIGKNFMVAVDKNMGKFFLTTTATQKGDVYGIDYQDKCDPDEEFKPTLQTIVNYNTKDKRNSAARNLKRYIRKKKDDDQEFYLESVDKK